MLNWTIGIARRGFVASLACMAVGAVALAQNTLRSWGALLLSVCLRRGTVRPDVHSSLLTHRWRELDSNFPYAGAMNLVFAPFVSRSIVRVLPEAHPTSGEEA